jgi:hypothetical protein
VTGAHRKRVGLFIPWGCRFVLSLSLCPLSFFVLFSAVAWPSGFNGRRPAKGRKPTQSTPPPLSLSSSTMEHETAVIPPSSGAAAAAAPG